MWGWSTGQEQIGGDVEMSSMLSELSLSLRMVPTMAPTAESTNSREALNAWSLRRCRVGRRLAPAVGGGASFAAAGTVGAPASPARTG